MSNSIEGLSPAISIEQKTTSRNPRSTVGTVTEIYDYMRLLWARVGVPYSPATGLPIVSQTVSQMVDRVHGDAGGHAALSAGADRAPPQGRVPQGIGRLSEARVSAGQDRRQDVRGRRGPARSTRTSTHDISVVVDRLIVGPELGNRLADSFETALGLADGIAITENADSGEETIFSAKFACPVSGFTIPEIEPRLFSFNNPFGACPACDGLGTKLYFDPDLVVHDHGRSLVRGRGQPVVAFVVALLHADAAKASPGTSSRSMHTPWRDLPEKMRQTILYGSAGEPIRMTYDDGLRQYSTERPFEGVLPNMERRFRETDSAWVREELGPLPERADLRGVRRRRLKPEALAVKIAGKQHQRGGGAVDRGGRATGSPGSPRR